MGRRILRAVGAILTYAFFVVFGGVFVVVGASGMVEGGTKALRAFDVPPTRHCGPRLTERCLRVDEAQYTGLDDADYGQAVTEDGRKLSVDLRDDDGLEPGDAIFVERWRGDVVAYYDRREERRHETTDWPDGRSSLGAGVAIFVLCAIFFVAGLAIAVGAPLAAAKERRAAA